jgi:hypothetical protein
LWWKSDTGMLYVRYNDGTSVQWVAAVPVPDMTGGVRFDIAQALSVPQCAQARANIGVVLAKKNFIVNSAMLISQRGAGLSSSAAPPFHAVDQFQSNTNGTTGVVASVQAQSRTPGGSAFRHRATVTTADAAIAAGKAFCIEQRLEGLRIADLKLGTSNAVMMTLQFGVRAPAGTYSVVLINGNGNRSYVAEYTITAAQANTDQLVQIAIPGDVLGTWPVNATLAAVIRWGLMAGSTYQQAAGSWGTGNVFGSPNQFNFLGTIGNVWELFDVGLYIGADAPGFVVPDFGAEMRACQRYYFKTFDHLVFPQQNAGYAGALMVSTSATSTFGGSYCLPAALRVTNPTVTTYNPVANNANWRDNNNSADRTVGTIAPGMNTISIWGAAGIVNGTNSFSSQPTRGCDGHRLPERTGCQRHLSGNANTGRAAVSMGRHGLENLSRRSELGGEPEDRRRSDDQSRWLPLHRVQSRHGVQRRDHAGRLQRQLSITMSTTVRTRSTHRPMIVR